MSLNWREIDAVLEEIPFEDALIRDIRQPSHPQLILELYRPGRPFRVLFSFANPACRLHLLSVKFSSRLFNAREVSSVNSSLSNRWYKIAQLDKLFNGYIIRNAVKESIFAFVQPAAIESVRAA